MLARAEASLETPLPISSALPELVARLSGAGAAVLVSPPGTGKTTLVPLALADALQAGGGTVVVAEPRRIAARAAARRMASLLGEAVGQQVGYAVRGDRRIGPATRVEVVTTGVLVRRLENDPELPGVGAIVLDECHERHLDTDLALAFALESRAVLRPDLLLLATSATADADRLSTALGGDDGPAPVIGADAPLFDVGTVWCPPTGPVDPPRGLRVDPRLLDHVASVVRRALRETVGDVLVFLPGAGEINGVANRLGGLADSSAGGGEDVDVLRLHGRLSGGEQDAVLQGGSQARRRVVLATAVAESSLTVPGVRTVVDAGLARVPRTDLSRGLNGLATVRVSRSAAHQRAGRAGREAPGVAYRCWSPAEQGRLPAHPEAEVMIADLTGFALSLTRWGDPDGTGLTLLDRPPAAAMTVARQTLQALGAVDGEGRITARGRRIAAAGVHPRLARALLDGTSLVGASRAAEVVAILADDSLAGGTDDLALAWRRLRSGDDPARTARWRAETERLRDGTGTPSRDHARTARSGPGTATDDVAAGIVAGLAYPERLVLARANAPGTFLMAGGTAAQAAAGSRLAAGTSSAGTPTARGWLAIAVAQRQAGAPAAQIRLAAVIDEATAREVGSTLLRHDDEVGWRDGDVVSRRVERLGAIVLAGRPLADPPRDLVDAALREGLRREGLGLLTWREAATALRARLAFCHAFVDAANGAAWPDVSDQALLDRIDDWLGPELHRARRRSDLGRVELAGALRRLLDHRQAARLDEFAPERIRVPSGSFVRVGYSDDYAGGEAPAAPVLAVKLQEVFGWAATPRIGGGRAPVVLHLLSPAGRPVAVTSDLESFWAGGYQAVRGELRGRYPRHPWPDDPTTAAPTKRVKPRS